MGVHTESYDCSRGELNDTLSKPIVQRCVEEGMEKIAVGDLSDIRDGKKGVSRNWGASRNRKLHGWEFARFTRLFEYKAKDRNIFIDRVYGKNTSRMCCCCGQIRNCSRVECGLYACSSCETVMNAEVNGAVNS